MAAPIVKTRGVAAGAVRARLHAVSPSRAGDRRLDLGRESYQPGRPKRIAVPGLNAASIQLAAVCTTGNAYLGLDAHPAVYRVPKLLLATEITLGGLNGDVAEQKSNLVEFAAGLVTQTGAGSPKILRR